MKNIAASAGSTCLFTTENAPNVLTGQMLNHTRTRWRKKKTNRFISVGLRTVGADKGLTALVERIAASVAISVMLALGFAAFGAAVSEVLS